MADCTPASPSEASENGSQVGLDVFKVRVTLTTLAFSGGNSVDLQEDGVLAIVGPNNSGKSAALRSISSALRGQEHSPQVCRPALVTKGTVEELLGQLEPYRSVEHPSSDTFIGPGFEVSGGAVKKLWDRAPTQRHVGDLARYFAVFLDTTSRLTGCGPGSTHAAGRVNAKDAFQTLYEDPQLQSKFSEVFREAFGTGIVFNPMPGSEIALHVGHPPALATSELLHSKSYARKVSTLPRLEAQGDGMKSFASILLATTVFPRPVLLIDEPEAFLHPPQERRVGRVLASDRVGRSQVIVATHSEDVIKGLLSGAPERLSIVRLTRSGEANHAKLLPNEQVAELWKSPVLRYSNILSGLFHEGVVITESDGDCRFFEAVQEALPPTLHKPDLFYTHSGGKDRLPTLVSALAALDVPVRVVADVDVLQDDTKLKKLVVSLGGDWSLIAEDWAATRTAIEARKNWYRAGDLLREITDVLGKLPPEATVDKETSKKVSGLVRQSSPWEEIKRNGLPGPLTGEPARRATVLIDGLQKIGLFVVPVGELEGFAKTIGGHGPRWVEGALARALATDPELANARAFVTQLVASFSTSSQ